MTVRYRSNPRGLQELGESKGVTDHLERVAEQLVDEARRIAPVRTGAYRDSLRVIKRRPGRVSAGTKISYGHIIEWGSRRQPPKAPLRKAALRLGLKLGAPNARR